jgi:hypothetical protein
MSKLGKTSKPCIFDIINNNSLQGHSENFIKYIKTIDKDAILLLVNSSRQA